MTDFNPLYDDRLISEIALTRGGGLYALVYGTKELDPEFDATDLTPLIGILEHAAQADPIDDSFDKSDPHVRGPYDLNQLNMFFRDSGLEDVVTVYYDEDEAAYYVYINTD